MGYLDPIGPALPYSTIFRYGTTIVVPFNMYSFWQLLYILGVICIICIHIDITD